MRVNDLKLITLICRITLLMLLVLPSEVNSQTENRSREVQLQQEIYQLVNQKRSIYSQAPIIWNDTIATIARTHSQAMADGKRPLGHDQFMGRDSLIRKYWMNVNGTGENVTLAADAEEAVDNWWTSEGHKANMLGDYTHTGIAVIAKGEFWFCTQIFVNK